jgi:hypothetical protein
VTTARRLSVGLVGVALIGSAAFASTPAHAVSSGAAPSKAATAVCLRPVGRPTKWREGADTTGVSERTKARVASIVRSAQRAPSAKAALVDALPGASFDARAAIPGKVVVPVFIHLIHGRKKSERRIGKWAARRMFRTLKAGYAGAQNPAAGATSITFRLRRITVSRNTSWFHAAPFGRADQQMKNRLHRGGARVLNLYVNRPRVQGQMLLGFSTFPWQRARRPKLDGVTVSDVSLPHGRARGYNLGDTVIHETGHWLGLLHTFEGGCTGGDDVADTPAEAYASYQCQEGRNTCVFPEYPDPANPAGPPVIDAPDPIHNFMDYSYDACMNSFTPGQNERMVAAYMRFRYGR